MLATPCHHQRGALSNPGSFAMFAAIRRASSFVMVVGIVWAIGFRDRGLRSQRWGITDSRHVDLRDDPLSRYILAVVETRRER